MCEREARERNYSPLPHGGRASRGYQGGSKGETVGNIAKSNLQSSVEYHQTTGPAKIRGECSNKRNVAIIGEEVEVEQGERDDCVQGAGLQWVEVEKRKANENSLKVGNVFNVFILDLPENIQPQELKSIMGDVGNCVDTYIPKKRSKGGKRFGFARFSRVIYGESICNQINKLKIQGSRLKAYPARYDRTTAQAMLKTSVFSRLQPHLEQVNVFKPTVNQGSSFKNVLMNNLPINNDGVHKALQDPVAIEVNNCSNKSGNRLHSVIATLHSLKVLDEFHKLAIWEELKGAEVSYLGGLQIRISFKNEDIATDFIMGGMQDWKNVFDALAPFQTEKVTHNRIAWIVLRSLNVVCWDYQAVVDSFSKFGKILSIPSKDDWGNNFSSTKCAILTNRVKPISELIIFHVGGYTFDGWMMEVEQDWEPRFLNNLEMFKVTSEGHGEEEDHRQCIGGGTPANHSTDQTDPCLARTVCFSQEKPVTAVVPSLVKTQKQISSPIQICTPIESQPEMTNVVPSVHLLGSSDNFGSRKVPRVQELGPIVCENGDNHLPNPRESSVGDTILPQHRHKRAEMVNDGSALGSLKVDEGDFNNGKNLITNNRECYLDQAVTHAATEADNPDSFTPTATETEIRVNKLGVIEDNIIGQSKSQKTVSQRAAPDVLGSGMNPVDHLDLGLGTDKNTTNKMKPKRVRQKGVKIRVKSANGAGPVTRSKSKSLATLYNDYMGPSNDDLQWQNTMCFSPSSDDERVDLYCSASDVSWVEETQFDQQLNHSNPDDDQADFLKTAAFFKIDLQHHTALVNDTLSFNRRPRVLT